MKKTVTFIVGLSLTITLLTATPAKADVDIFFPITAPLYAAGAILSVPFDIVGSLFYSPNYYYPEPDSGYYYYPPAYYGGYYGYYGGYHREFHGGHHRDFHGGYDRDFHGGYRR